MEQVRLFRIESRMRIRFFLKTSVLVAGLLVALSGCATSSGGHVDGPQEVQGDVPTGADAAFYPPPAGPEILVAKNGANAAAEDGAEPEKAGVVRRAALNELIGRGPGYVFSQVETKAVHEGQKFVGFELIAMSPTAQHAVGSAVQVGDIITHINGVQQRLPDDYLRAWKLLGEAQTVRIDLIREGEASQVSWQVE